MAEQSIREILAKYANFRDVGLRFPDKYKLPGGIENLCCEIYNPETQPKGEDFPSKSEDVYFVCTHPDWQRMNFFGLGPDFWKGPFVCKPGEWIFLPHAQYTRYMKSGAKKYELIVNVGDAMFKGNKFPSRPEMQKTQIFVPKH